MKSHISVTCALVALLLLAGCTGAVPNFGTIIALMLATPITVIAVFVSSAFAGRRTLLESAVYLLMCAAIAPLTPVGDFVRDDWPQPRRLNVAAQVLTRSLGVAGVVCVGVASVTLPNGASLVFAMSWAAFAFVFVFVLQVGDELIGSERKALAQSINHVCHSMQINHKVLVGLEDELSRMRDIDQWSYLSVLIAPLIAIALVLAHRFTEDVALQVMVSIAALLMAVSILALSLRLGARLGSPLFWPSDVALSWDQYKNVFALSCDAKTIMLYEGIHNLAIAIGYVVAAVVILAGRSQVLPAVAIAMLVVVIVAALGLCVPLFIGYRASLTNFRTRAQNSTSASYIELSSYEKELYELRPPFAALGSWRFLIPAVTAGGAVTALSVKILGFLVK